MSSFNDLKKDIDTLIEDIRALKANDRLGNCQMKQPNNTIRLYKPIYIKGKIIGYWTIPPEQEARE